MYSYKDIVKYSEVDRNGNLPLYGILSYFQNCINLHSGEIGKDYKHMMELGKAWVLIAWKVKLVKNIKIYDKIETGTWSYGFDKMYGYRNYVILDELGNRLAYADTKWILLDLKSRMLLRVSEEDIRGFAMGERICMPECSRKLKLSENKVSMDPVRVLKTYIDTNGHMNNTAYFRLAEEYIPDGFAYNTVDAVYVKETTEGTIMIPNVHQEKDGIGISFTGEDGTIFTNMKFYSE